MEFYTAKQLAGLPGMPGTERGVRKMGDRESWPHRQREGRGGGREYAASALPKTTLAHLTDIAISETVKAVVAESVNRRGIVLSEYEVRDWQREERDARAGVCQAVRVMAEQHGLSLDKAFHRLVWEAENAGEQSHQWKQLELAKDNRGRSKISGKANFPSLRSVQRWLGDQDLTPAARKKDLAVPSWSDDFLDCYQQPQKPSVEHAYAEFCRHYGSQDKPSIHQVRRYLTKLPAIVREKGRMGPRELKNIKPFVRRAFDELWPNDVWSADGHTFDAEVSHPLHGRPFRPEITSIIDIGTRKIVGFSVGLAESSLETVDALRYAVTNHGIPGIFYVDNGSGYANQLLKSEGTGLLSRCHITVKHSLPYNSQARGVIERLHRSVWVPAAKSLPSYMGADMDREAKQQNFKLTRSGDKDGVLHLPISWPNFIKLCEDAIQDYNQRSHSGLPKYVNADGKRQHYSPDAYWQHKAATLDGYHAVTLAADEAEMLFKPRVERKVLRGEVSLFGNKYFSQDLAVMHDETVQVAYDIHDPQAVWLYDGEGRYLCKAEFAGNAKAYFAQSVVEMARDKRADGRLKRVEAAADEIRAERDGQPALEAIPANELPGMEIVAKKIEIRKEQPVEMAATIPQEDRERYWFWCSWNEKAANGTAIPDGLRLFMSSYPTTAKFRAMDAFFNPDKQQEYK